ncbi:hypothetical protein BsWGS_07025 [Bradybaena similaris]
MCGRGLHESLIDRPLLCAWGANSCGQLGYGFVSEKEIPSVNPVPLDLGSDCLKSAGGGGGFSYAVTESGEVFTCGNNNRGQLGHGDLKNLSVFTHCQCLSQIKIVRIAAGWDFMLAISDTGTLLSWGSNTFGQLGRDVHGGAGYDAVPAQVGQSDLGHQVDISAGLRHGLSLSVSVSCMEKPAQVFAGMYHSGLLTEAGSILMWGCNKFGQCGQKPDTDQTVLVPSKVVFPVQSDKTTCSIISVTSGWTHVIARTDSGILYSWGRADLGQLGRTCTKSCDHIPGVVAKLASVRSHSCGSEHSLAVTENGQVFSWGWNEHSICGTEHEENIQEPLRVARFSHTQMTHVGCGAGHSFCIGVGVGCGDTR